MFIPTPQYKSLPFLACSNAELCLQHPLVSTTNGAFGSILRRCQ